MTKYIKGQSIKIIVSGTVAADLDTSERNNYVLFMETDAGGRHYISGSVLAVADSIDLGPVPVALPTESGIYVHEAKGLNPYQLTEDGKWFIIPMHGGNSRREFLTEDRLSKVVGEIGPLVKVA